MEPRGFSGGRSKPGRDWELQQGGAEDESFLPGSSSSNQKKSEENKGQLEREYNVFMCQSSVQVVTVQGVFYGIYYIGFIVFAI